MLPSLVIRHYVWKDKLFEAIVQKQKPIFNTKNDIHIYNPFSVQKTYCKFHIDVQLQWWCTHNIQKFIHLLRTTHYLMCTVYIDKVWILTPEYKKKIYLIIHVSQTRIMFGSITFNRSRKITNFMLSIQKKKL